MCGEFINVLGSQYVANGKDVMGSMGKQQEALHDLDIKLTQALDAVKAAKGQKTDRVKELCTLVGITKRELAAGLVLSTKGDISIAEISRRLAVDRTTVYTWPEIVRALKAR